MSRLSIGDLSRWLTATAEESPLRQSFDCLETGTRCRLDVMGSVPITVEVFSDAGRIALGQTRPHDGPTTIEFVGHGLVQVELVAQAGAVVAVRRYDDHVIIDDDGDSFTTYDPANFVDSDIDRIERLMRHNQLRFMAQIEAKYDAQIARLSSVQSEEKTDGTEGQESGAQGLSAREGDEKAQGGDPAQAAVTGND